MSHRLAPILTGLTGLALGISLLCSAPSASAETPALIDQDEALALARESGEPVVATALTDEHTLVTADPETGLLTAELSAAVSRVSDGEGGWREPSTTLVPSTGGRWVAEATATEVGVSGGGSDAFLTLGDGDGSLSFGWPESLPTPAIAGNLATYADVVPGVDLVVRAAVDGAESFLVVKDAEAAQDPLVRSMPITITGEGLEPAESEGGTVVYVDDDGEERFWVPPAYLWDSAGHAENATLDELLDPAEGSRVEELPAALPEGTAGRVAFGASSAWDVLDDPETVFPVVIDPSGSGSQTYAVRVTQDFTKYNSDIGSTSKLGYNGWTSPYYKSRMYHQFKWHTHGGVPVPAERIVSVKFEYLQTHSPQHSGSDTDFGPTVKVQFHYVIDSSTTWSNQPDAHPGIGSVTNDYAVGHKDYCGNTHTQTWNVSSMVLAERYKYPTRTTVTVGIRSNDETDKNGWREYKYSSAKLTITYEAQPPAPTELTVSPLIPGQGMVTNASGVDLSVKVNLTKNQCPDTYQQNCARAKFDVTDTTTSSVVYSGHSAGVTPGTVATVIVPSATLVDGRTYQVNAYTQNLATGDYSATAATSTFETDFPPGATSIAWASGSPTMNQQLQVVATNTSDPAASFGWTVDYLDENSNPQSLTGTWLRGSAPASTVTTIPVGASGGYFGSVTVTVWAIDARTNTGPSDALTASVIH